MICTRADTASLFATGDVYARSIEGMTMTKKTYEKPVIESEPAFATLSGCSEVSDDVNCLGAGLSTVID